MPTLQVADVIRLVEAGVDDQVIIRHAQRHRLAAALTADDLIVLTKGGVSAQLITTLQGIPVAPNSKAQPVTLLPPVREASSQSPKPTSDAPAASPSTPGPLKDAAPGDSPATGQLPVTGRMDLPVSHEELRRILDGWERTWLLDQPDHTAPYHTHGGLM